MSKSQCLNGTWGLTWAEGACLMNPDYYTAPTLAGRKLLPAAVPAPIHRVLQDAGVIATPAQAGAAHLPPGLSQHSLSRSLSRSLSI